MRGIQRSPVNSPHKKPVTQSFGASLILTKANRWINSGVAGNLRHHDAHCDVIVMRMLDIKMTPVEYWDLSVAHVFTESDCCSTAVTHSRWGSALTVKCWIVFSWTQYKTILISISDVLPSVPCLIDATRSAQYVYVEIPPQSNQHSGCHGPVQSFWTSFWRMPSNVMSEHKMNLMKSCHWEYWFCVLKLDVNAHFTLILQSISDIN